MSLLRIRIPLVAALTMLVLSGILVTTPNARAASAHAPAPYSVLQMNLCNSGKAPCYSGGRSVLEGVELIEAKLPSLVTLNEVCENDVTFLRDRLSVRGYAYSVFQPARNGDDSGPATCTNGQPYGIGMIVRGEGSIGYGGQYAAQVANAERRVYWCTDWLHQVACITHLTNMSTAVAGQQAHEILSIAQSNGADVGKKAIVAGDFNLNAMIVPPGFTSRGDGGVQKVITHGWSSGSREIIEMYHTDHPALFVRLYG
ncbi:hypothetical protein [Nonomuraea sp. NPDC023979]|uniref:endonuclease/exonuclease/phosphatase family protein n=1 Tax=Nonomuraea sp. NPDC023979 TaxID=3154796 RepID=UPI003411AB04